MKKTETKTGLSPMSAIVMTLGIYFGAQLLAAIAFAIYAGFSGIDESAVFRLIEDSISGQFVFIFIVQILSLYFLWLFLSWRNIRWQEIGLGKPKLGNFIYSPLAYGIYFVSILLIVAVVGVVAPGINIDQEQQIGFEGASGILQLAMVGVALVVMPAIVEEILVRGFLYSGLVKKFSKIASALIASALFGVAHLQFGTGEPLLWVAAIDTFVLSMVLIYLREKTGNIWAGVVVHMIKNGLAFVSIFILKLA